MATFPDLPTPITEPADLPVQPDEGPGAPPLEPSEPVIPVKVRSGFLSTHFTMNRSFLHAAAFCWPMSRPSQLLR